ncbi:MAG: aminotransferase class I/II-fold pyridoxal phosphate-dependent enzyme, partial [Clostridia bacterium]|nr:aminotransferase class I/II-fold pyridoxal phosphate-dependent enzyme [Clostridia bacterium]
KPDNVGITAPPSAECGPGNAIGLINKYDNLLVVNTFSKSRSLAGARVGYAIASAQIIEDVKKIKNSFHPYNVNSLSSALATQAIADDEYFKYTVEKVKASRQKLTEELQSLGFYVLPSAANFVLAKTAALSGNELYLKLKDRGVLVRYFSDERIAEFVRISVGTDEEIDKLST